MPQWVTVTTLAFRQGIFGEFFMGYFFNFEARINWASYWEKSAMFALSAGAGFLLFKYALCRPTGLAVQKSIRDIDMGFRGMCVALGIFFAITLASIGFF